MRPRIQVLDEAMVDRVIDEALSVLSRQGVLIEDPDARGKLEGFGLPADPETNRVHFPR